MKYIIVLLLSSSFALIAGTPDEEHHIDLLREAFRDATQPTNNDLYFDYPLVCWYGFTIEKMGSATPGVTLGYANFISTSQGIVNRSDYFRGRLPLKRNGNELVGKTLDLNGDEAGFYFVRSHNDAIIIERAVKKSKPSLPSISRPDLQTMSYAYCINHERSSGAKKILHRPWSSYSPKRSH